MRFVDEQQLAVGTGREGNRSAYQPVSWCQRLCDLERIVAETAEERVQKGEKGGAAV
jgi:hypothetical protein